MGKKHLNIVSEGDICFDVHQKYNLDCRKKECRQWFDNSKSNNCVLIAAQRGPYKQEEIGEYFGLTRMRVCQIEKGILAKVREFEQLDILKEN